MQFLASRSTKRVTFTFSAPSGQRRHAFPCKDRVEAERVVFRSETLGGDYKPSNQPKITEIIHSY